MTVGPAAAMRRPDGPRLIEDDDMTMWVATREGRTPCGVVAAGRLVSDGDPMLIGAEPGLFVRVVDGDQVEEATAEPGRMRRTRRTA